MRFRSVLTLILAFISFAVCSASAGAASVAVSASQDSIEQLKIQKLISIVRSSGATFFRNGSGYDSQAAADHLMLKLSKAGDRVKTARQFIQDVASKSFFTGTEYTIQTRAGEHMPAGRWLLRELEQMERVAGDPFFVSSAVRSPAL